MSEVRRLTTFLDFARLGTIAAVAEHRQYSTSAVSQQLEKLADDLGVALLEPHGRVLRLTPAGELLVYRGPALLDTWESIKAELAASESEIRGSVTLAAFQSAALALVPPLLESLRDTAPQLSVSCTQAEPEASVLALRSRDVDIAIVEHYPGQSAAPYEDLDAVRLAEDDMLLAVPPAWGTIDRFEQLADRPWAFEERGEPERAWAEALCHTAGFAPRIAHETSDVVVRCSLVASGAAAAFIPALTPEPLRLGVTLLPLPEGQARTLVALTRKSSAADRAVRFVIDQLGAITAPRAPQRG